MYWNLASSWEASQHGLLLAVSCRFRHSAWSCQNLEVTGLKAADALQKDLDIATGMVRVKLSNGPDILLSGTFFWWEMDMGYQILIQNCLMRLSDSVTKSGSYWLTHLVITTSCNFGAIVILVFHKGDWGTHSKFLLLAQRQTDAANKR